MSAMVNHRYRAKDRVEVKRRDFTGRGEPAWKAGSIKEVGGKGCFVDVEGNSAFYNWNDIRPVQREEAPRPSPMKAPLTAFARVSNLSDFVKPEAASLSPEAERVVEAAARSIALETSHPLRTIPDPARMQSATMETRVSIEPTKTYSKMRKPHRVTRCGEVFRRVRLMRNVGQQVVAVAVGATTQIISRIELGDLIPSDDLLLRFSEWGQYDLADLEQKRESDRRQLRLEPKEPPTVQAPLRPAPPPAPLVDPLALPFSQALDFVDFLQGLKRLVPCPSIAEKRTLWMTAAEQLWDLSQKP